MNANDINYQEDYRDYHRDMKLAQAIKRTSPAWYAQMAPDIEKEQRQYHKVLDRKDW